MRGSPFFDGVAQVDVTIAGMPTKLPIFYYDDGTMTALFPARYGELRRLLPDPRYVPARLAPGLGIIGISRLSEGADDILTLTAGDLPTPRSEQMQLFSHLWMDRQPLSSEFKINAIESGRTSSRCAAVELGSRHPIAAELSRLCAASPGVDMGELLAQIALARGAGGRTPAAPPTEADALAREVSATDGAVAAASAAVQVFGGTGYMCETDAERLLRVAMCCRLWPESNWAARARLVELSR